MDGVVSLLDEKHYRLVEELWAEMRERFGLQGIDVTPYPHFSYHVAESYEVGQVERILLAWAQETAVFSLKTAGIGIFTGPQPVIYLPVTRTTTLSTLHDELWPALDAYSTGSSAYYAPENWFPHISIGFGDIQPEKLGAIVEWLNEQTWAWDVTVNNFAFFRDPGNGPHILHRRFNFRK